MRTTDSVGNRTYAVRLVAKGMPNNEFYNLIVADRADGQVYEPFVQAYTVDPDYYHEYRNGDRNEKGFRGTVGTYSLSSLGETGLSFSKLMVRNPCYVAEVGRTGAGQSLQQEEPGSVNVGNHYGKHYERSLTVVTTTTVNFNNSRGGGGSKPKKWVGSVEVGEGHFIENGLGLKRSMSGKGEWIEDCPYGYDLIIPINDLEDDKIINELKGKADCVYKKLKQTNGDLFKKTIGKFIKDPKYDLILTVGNCEKSDVACTDGSQVDTNGDITMIIEDVAQPSLELAATILHEGIHAEIYRYVSRRKKNLDPNNRARIFQLYQYYMGLTNVTTYTGHPVTDAQHVYMAENYVKPIASAIRQLDNNRFPLEYYMWYGWEGLEGEDFQNKLTSELSTKYNNFQETVNGTTKFKCN